MVIHDSDLTRLCGISRRADTLTAAEYGKYGILGTDLHAPMLEDVLPFFEGKTPLIVEIKTDGAIPVWLSHALDELGIAPASFSKYGAAYALARAAVNRNKEVTGDDIAV